ncbi:alpha/beta hydrolase [Nonomuraea sp. WAC 01424]|uniref:alpha/beta fold hydrolase n=1 Tax=Nonomuraea sp. WAC 01424 TaxID=2203200 RepID=UPI000F78ED11|nr:alpha/beta hydrolase [Nonomuraea sp. WAC 01424]RSN05583.1 alpha/beta hydrolase [Nonomuraea sp. WAC 01424]
MNTVISGDGTRIAYDQVGEGPAVVLVDGAMCHRGAGPNTPLAAELARGFTVLTYDRRGRGDSGDNDAYSVAREVDDLAAVIGRTGGGAGAVGHSSGAVLALEAAVAGVPIARLALFEPPPLGDDAGLADELDKLVEEGRRGAAVEAFQLAVGIPPEVVASMAGAPFRPALEALAPTLVYDARVTGTDTLSRYAAVTVPTLLIDSEASPERLRASTEAVAGTVPGARRRSLAGGFHDVEAGVLAPVLAGFFA